VSCGSGFGSPQPGVVHVSVIDGYGILHFGHLTKPPFMSAYDISARAVVTGSGTLIPPRVSAHWVQAGKSCSSVPA